MENKKIITVSFLTAGALAGYVVNILLGLLAGSFGSVAQIVSNDVIGHGLPVAVFIGTFFALQFNSKVLEWAEEVVSEIKKVVWPSRKDTSAMTVVVCVMLLISGVILGLFDTVSTFFVNYLVSF